MDTPTIAVQPEADASSIVVAAAFAVGQAQAGPGEENATGSSRTLRERVASYGRDLLGLSTLEAAAKPDTGADDRVPGVFESLEGGGLGGSSRRLSRSDSGSQPTCLICLEALTSEDFLVRLSTAQH